MPRPVALIILDGWWVSKNPTISAIMAAKTPYIDSLYQSASNTQLQASEEAVWLPVWQVGNSEVGHMTLGTGRVKYQDLIKINKAVDSGELAQHPLLNNAIQKATSHKKTIHLIGLMSDGGVHSHIDHIVAVADMLRDLQTPVMLHMITDGRDTDPHASQEYIKRISDHIAWTSLRLASVVGRYYAMDRDQRRERTKVAYDLLLHGQGKAITNRQKAIQECYDEWKTDEFLPAMRLAGNGFQPIKEGDLVININFRSDRVRQLTSCLTQQEYKDYGMNPLSVDYLCMTQYDATFQGLTVLFPPETMEETLGEVISKAGKSQLRIAETEKYPHVTFFFNAGQEDPYPGEERIMIPSPKVATYDLQPAMSADEITTQCIAHIQKHKPDFICINYANPDMVGHTGVFDAVVQACETVDSCLEKLLRTLQNFGYDAIVLADHGNADYMINPDGTANTAHSLAQVPCFLITQDNKRLRSGGTLADVAPTILELMWLEQPLAMTGKSLLIV